LQTRYPGVRQKKTQNLRDPCLTTWDPPKRVLAHSTARPSADTGVSPPWLIVAPTLNADNAPLHHRENVPHNSSWVPEQLKQVESHDLVNPSFLVDSEILPESLLAHEILCLLYVQVLPLNLTDHC